MPTANITWTNRSTNDSPTGTKIERTEGFPFGHANAPAPVEVANGDTGGLDPTLSGVGAGSYADTTISGDTSYAYRVSTLKGDEVATSIATPMEFVYDSVNDLGYPGGSPVTTAQYTISTAPFLHMDMNRSSGYEDQIVPGSNPDYNSGDWDNNLMDQGFSGVTRHGEFVITGSSYSNAPYISTHDLGNGVVRSFITQPQGQYRYFSYLPSVAVSEQSCADGFTMFLVSDVLSLGGIPLGDTKPGNAAYNDGIYYKTQDLNYNSWGCMGASATHAGWSHTGPSIGHYSQNPIHITAYRLNNDAAAFASGSIQGQLFDGGDLIGESTNRHSVSYHNANPNPDYSNHLGAAGFNTAYGLGFLGNAHQERHVAEALYFDSALSLSDMNTVIAYLGNKFNIIPTTIAANDLIN